MQLLADAPALSSTMGCCLSRPGPSTAPYFRATQRSQSLHQDSAVLSVEWVEQFVVCCLMGPVGILRVSVENLILALLLALYREETAQMGTELHFFSPAVRLVWRYEFISAGAALSVTSLLPPLIALDLLSLTISLGPAQLLTAHAQPPPPAPINPRGGRGPPVVPRAAGSGSECAGNHGAAGVGKLPPLPGARWARSERDGTAPGACVRGWGGPWRRVAVEPDGLRHRQAQGWRERPASARRVRAAARCRRPGVLQGPFSSGRSCAENGGVPVPETGLVRADPAWASAFPFLSCRWVVTVPLQDTTVSGGEPWGKTVPKATLSTMKWTMTN